MLKLKDITLFAISDSKYIDKTIKAINYCLSKTEFHDVKLLTDYTGELPNIIKRIYLHEKLDEITYSKICINDLNNYINSDFVLMIQWDGFIINENLWNDSFLKYDYIGSPWGFPDNCRNRVGNGGFSLRSKKFLEVSSFIKYDPYNYDVYTELQRIDRPIAPEDWFLCYHSYKKLLDNNIKFAPIDVAYSFSVEHPSHIKNYDRDNILTYNSFGFHGQLNTAAIKLLEK